MGPLACIEDTYVYIQICMLWRSIEVFFFTICIQICYVVSTERFYHSVHNSHRPGSGLTATSNGISRCPFRAAIQSQPQHSSAAPDCKTTTAEVKSSIVSKGKHEYEEDHCQVKRATEDGRCECAAQGLQPIGQPLPHCGSSQHNHFCTNCVTIYCMWLCCRSLSISLVQVCDGHC